MTAIAAIAVIAGIAAGQDASDGRRNKGFFMTISPIHHVPLRPEYKSPFTAAFAVEDARIVFISGCGPIPIYHAHPHDPVAEAEWLKGGIREQTEKTFANIGTILEASGADWSNVVKLNIYMTDVGGQDVLNEISARHFDPANPPPRTVVEVTALAHPAMLIEIEAVAAVPKK